MAEQPPRRPLIVSLGGPPSSAPVHPSASGHAGQPVLLRTHGYVLRSLGAADVTPEILAWFNEPAMLQGLNLPPLGFTLERLRAFIAGFDNLHNHVIGIFDESQNLLVGFYTIDVSLAHRIGNITTGLGAATHLGKGTLWATMDALLDDFFDHRGLEKMSARILAKNRRMLFNFINNTRFVFEARLRRECLAPNGERVDLLVFAAHKGGSRADGTAP